ncbi:helix-turn-helix domain-containing protein [Chryseobacterium turcicum]|uniref:Helix-turn-helix domain-containing protein n=1 Tax=Chryseobacterium turcicum TaxID=2898076 RepID=A0A9Q3V6A9_9FLAO|nr:helix-turn-helix domain-containing protein [Chryseobacterium turcicum]MCD1117580.1 helix-turn-helix domain-containing protein [Chryseobacterium turcicum]
MRPIGPDYKRIYLDILENKFPDKKALCSSVLAKHTWTAQDILEINDRIFNSVNYSSKKNNMLHRSYRKVDILKILDYQKMHRLNNTQLAVHFRLSRNTVGKWKKIFVI